MQGILNDTIIQEVRKSNCFDFLRYLFALSLIIAHFCTLTNQEQFWFITGGMRVKAFFTITGFLVTYSFLRRDCQIKSYARKRFVRIIPAYVVCILVCLLVGWVVTSLPSGDFFASLQTWKYTVANLLMLNWLEPELPQTFQNNVVPQMNGSLWSMKQEVLFYVLVPFIVMIMHRIGKRVFIFPVIAICLVIYQKASIQTQYFMYFFSGMFYLLFFDWVSKQIRFILPVAIIAEAMVYVVRVPYLTEFCFAIEPLTFSALIIGIAYHCKPLNFFRRFDNVTYGLYLYHFPVIQVLILYGVKDYNIYLCFFLTLLITSIMASLSWFVIEKPLMNRYK